MSCFAAAASTSPTCRGPPQPGTALPGRVGRRAGPRRDAPSRCASSSPTTRSPAAASWRAPWWGDGGAYFVRQLRPHDRRQRQRARRPGLVLRPAHRDGHAEDHLRRQPGPGRRQRHFDGPDNITVSPYGGVILAEDGEGMQHLVGRRPTQGERTRWPATSSTTASSPARPSAPDGKILFANIQTPGYVLAITRPVGPAEQRRRLTRAFPAGRRPSRRAAGRPVRRGGKRSGRSFGADEFTVVD